MPDPFPGAQTAPMSVSVDGDLLELLQEGAKARSSPPSQAPSQPPIEVTTLSPETDIFETETIEDYRTAHDFPGTANLPHAAAAQISSSESLTALLKGVQGRRVAKDEHGSQVTPAQVAPSQVIPAQTPPAPQLPEHPPTVATLQMPPEAEQQMVREPTHAAFAARTVRRQFIPAEESNAAPDEIAPETSATSRTLFGNSLATIPKARAYEADNHLGDDETLPVSSRPKWIPLAIGGSAIVLAALVAAFIAYRNAGPQAAGVAVSTGASASPGSAAAQTASPLDLRVESRDKTLIGIRWNAGAFAITNAKQGRLVILEREQQPRVVDLQPSQLRIGHLYYETPADRVEFRLEIVDTAGSTTQESFLALSPSPASPASAPLAPGSGTATGTGTPRVAAPTTPSMSGAPNTVPRAQIQPGAPDNPAIGQPKPQARVFQAPQREQARAVYLEPPTDATGASPLPLTLGIPETLTGANISPPPVAAPPQAVPVAPQNTGSVRVSSSLQAGNLIKRVAPQYPATARASGIHGLVRFNATIGKDGTIRNLKAISGNPILTPAAAEAVRQWVYRPALLNGQPQEVTTQIDINFTLH